MPTLVLSNDEIRLTEVLADKTFTLILGKNFREDSEAFRFVEEVGRDEITLLSTREFEAENQLHESMQCSVCRREDGTYSITRHSDLRVRSIGERKILDDLRARWHAVNLIVTF